MNIIKRNGKRQNFSMMKVSRSLEKALKEGKVSAVKRKRLIKEICESLNVGLKGKRVIKAVDLRRMVLRRLERLSKPSLRAWRRYDKKRH